MKKSLYFLQIILMLGLLIPFGFIGTLFAGEDMSNTPPKYLYKILSLENWTKSQSAQFVVLSQDDTAFIHLATEEQLKGIADKYWSHAPDYVILKIEATKLPGELVFEANKPGGNKYYHLYKGSIPLESVTNITLVRSTNK